MIPYGVNCVLNTYVHNYYVSKFTPNIKQNKISTLRYKINIEWVSN